MDEADYMLSAFALSLIVHAITPIQLMILVCKRTEKHAVQKMSKTDAINSRLCAVGSALFDTPRTRIRREIISRIMITVTSNRKRHQQLF